MDMHNYCMNEGYIQQAYSNTTMKNELLKFSSSALVS